MALHLPGPDKPLSLDEVVETYPRLRQSFLSKFDDCALSAYFDLRYRAGEWGGLASSMGILMHRFFSECLKEMKMANSEYLEEGIALATLEEVLEQRDVPFNERVRIPIREIPTLRWMAVKFVRDNRFTIENVVDVEHRLEAELEYRDNDGTLRTRSLTGQLDLLVADPNAPEEAIIVDWKSGWGLPPKRDVDHRDPGLSYHGFFQQRFYGWLVMKSYPHIKGVTLREFYTRRSQARPARIPREELPRVEEALQDLARELDEALAHGKPQKLDFDHVGPWRPSPGKHCGFCTGARYCPIESDAREVSGAPASRAAAERLVAELEVAEAIRSSHREALRPAADIYGPLGSKWAKGRRAFGYKTQKGGKPILTFFTPEGTDRAPSRQEEDSKLEDALRRSAEEAAEPEETS